MFAQQQLPLLEEMAEMMDRGMILLPEASSGAIPRAGTMKMTMTGTATAGGGAGEGIDSARPREQFLWTHRQLLLPLFRSSSWRWIRAADAAGAGDRRAPTAPPPPPPRPPRRRQERIAGVGGISGAPEDDDLSKEIRRPKRNERKRKENETKNAGGT